VIVEFALIRKNLDVGVECFDEIAHTIFDDRRKHDLGRRAILFNDIMDVVLVVPFPHDKLSFGRNIKMRSIKILLAELPEFFKPVFLFFLFGCYKPLPQRLDGYNTIFFPTHQS
jgi:hypothetical protein